jgi:hypothetical protein
VVSPAPPPTLRQRWRALKARYTALVDAYGRVAIGTWFSLFALTLGGFYVAIEAGFRPEGTAAGLGTFGMAYAATQVTKPARLLATLVLTPLVARGLGRRPAGPAASPADGEVPGV